MKMNSRPFNRCSRVSHAPRFNIDTQLNNPRPGSSRTGRRFSNQEIPIATDLTPLSGARLVIVSDDDNLRLSSRNRALRFSYRKTLDRLNGVANVVMPLAVVVADSGDTRRQAYFQNRGWRTLVIPRETALTCNGPVVKSNADFDIVFEVGHLVSAGQFDTLLLATGDGDLAVAIGRGVRRKRPDLRLFTLSVAGSASTRLRNRPDLFDGFIVAGRDLSRSWSGEEEIR
jgi:hypothetical protein